MDTLARSLLEKLLAAGDKSVAGVRSRAPALTASHLKPYLDLRSLQQKNACEVSLHEARVAGAIELVVDPENPQDGFIERVNLKDVKALARFLGKVTYADLLADATERLSDLVPSYPVLADVLQTWSRMTKVRQLGPADVQDWVDAVKVLDYTSARIMESSILLPIREASGKLFNDTKRIERLAGPVDVLLTGDIASEAREAWEVFQEIGLFRAEQPVLLAGLIEIERERVTSLLDAPYSGFPAATVQRIAGKPRFVITIENLTTFHSEAKRLAGDPVLLIYTAGMPNPPWRSMYARILENIPLDVPVYHWGDIDEGGFRIAAVIAKEASKVGHSIKPWPSMHPDNVPQELRSPASDHTIRRMVHFAESAGWTDLAKAIAEAKFTVEQESLA